MDEPKKPSPVATFFKEEFFKWAARTSFLILLTVIAWAFTPVGERLLAIWNGPSQTAEIILKLETIGNQVSQLNRDMVIVRAPTEIVEYGPATNFTPPCRAGEACLLTLEIRRTSETAAECKVISPAIRREIVAATGGRTWEPEAIPQASRNVGLSFVLTEVQVQMPLGLVPGRYYYRQTTFYEGCPWQHDGNPPVSSESPLIVLEIVE